MESTTSESLIQGRHSSSHLGVMDTPSLLFPSLHSVHMEAPVDLNLHPSGIVPVIQNIVATVNLECRLDLKTIALHARNAEYNPKARFHFLIGTALCGSYYAH